MAKATYHTKLLEYMREHPEGLNSFFAMNIGGKQVNARITELRGMGHKIISIQNKNRSVTWILQEEIKPKVIIPQTPAKQEELF